MEKIQSNNAMFRWEGGGKKNITRVFHLGGGRRKGPIRRLTEHCIVQKNRFDWGMRCKIGGMNCHPETMATHPGGGTGVLRQKDQGTATSERTKRRQISILVGRKGYEREGGRRGKTNYGTEC